MEGQGQGMYTSKIRNIIGWLSKKAMVHWRPTSFIEKKDEGSTNLVLFWSLQRAMDIESEDKMSFAIKEKLEEDGSFDDSSESESGKIIIN